MLVPRGCWLVLFATLLASGAVAQVPLPATHAAADAEAHYQDEVIPSAPVVDDVFAFQNALAIPLGVPQGSFATSSASGQTLDFRAPADDRRVRSSSEVLALAGVGTPIDPTVGASSSAATTVYFVAAYEGPDPPPSHAAVDVRLVVGGELEVGPPLSGSGDDLETGFRYTATGFSQTQQLTPIETGGADLRSSFAGTELVTTGSLFAPGDFTDAPPSLGIRRVTLFKVAEVDNFLFLPLDPVTRETLTFAIRIELDSHAFAALAAESAARASFDTLPPISLDSSTQGVSFRQVSQVPEPAGWLFGIVAGATLALLRPQRRRLARAPRVGGDLSTSSGRRSPRGSGR